MMTRPERKRALLAIALSVALGQVILWGGLSLGINPACGASVEPLVSKTIAVPLLVLSVPGWLLHAVAAPCLGSSTTGGYAALCAGQLVVYGAMF